MMLLVCPSGFSLKGYDVINYDESTNIITKNGSTAATLNTGRGEMGGTGIATAALAIGGRVFPPTTGQTKTEQWNGSSWTEMNDINLRIL